ncbi:MAG: sulfurtransferase TusA family protein [Nitrososphaerota archaeon]
MLCDSPSLVAEAPYGDGWLVKLEAEGWYEASFVRNDEVRLIYREKGVKCFRHIPDYSVSGVGGECPETLARLSELMARLAPGERVYLMTDNPKADKDVGSWANLNGYAILEMRVGGTLRHFIIGKS